MTTNRYIPDSNSESWATVEAFVRSAVDDASDATAYSANELYRASSRLATWAWQSAGLSLDRSQVFNRDVIARFISIGCREFKPAVRGNLRSQLLRMSEALLDRTQVPRRLQPLPAADPTAPYSALDLVSLRSWAALQTTPARRSNAAVLLALGIGAGLSATEIGNLRVGDIVPDDLGVQVRITGERERVVPVLHNWCAVLVERQGTLASERFAFREFHTAFYPNLVSNFVNRSRVMGVRPQTQRMRTTWIVGHLEAATPVVPLMQAAGVESLEALTRYLRFVKHVDPAEARAKLSGA